MNLGQHDEKDNAVNEAEVREMRFAIAAQSEKIDAMYNALMVTQPGQSKSLLERMAVVTVAIEGGQSTGRMLIWVAGILAAIGSIYIAFHTNQPN